MRTLRNCKLEDIKIGEVFAVYGCWQIFEKRGNNDYLMLSCDWDGHEDGKHCTFDKSNNIFFLNIKVKSKREHEMSVLTNFNPTTDIYKLPLSVQRLWKTGE